MARHPSSSSSSLVNFPTSVVLLLTITVSLVRVVRSSSVVSALLFRNKTRRRAARMEDTVRRYFDGVDRKDAAQIRSCFGTQATIRDVCGVSDTSDTAGVRTVPSVQLVDRCMEFLAAHPDCRVDFHYGPEKGQTSDWVVAHWYETGTWSGESCGVAPPVTAAGTGRPMAVEGQTRFLVDPVDFKITDIVVTRTFTEWEMAMSEKRKVQ